MFELAWFLLELFGEIFLEVLAEGVTDAIDRGLRISVRRKQRRVLDAIYYFIIGSAIGWASTVAFPRAFSHLERAHGISLILSPMLTGFAMSRIGKLLAKRGIRPVPIERFLNAFSFALGMAIMRFFFTF